MLQLPFIEVSGDRQHYVEKVRVSVKDFGNMTYAAVTVSDQLCGYVTINNLPEDQYVELTCTMPLLGDNVGLNSTRPGESFVVSLVEAFGWTKAYVDENNVLNKTTFVYHNTYCSPTDPALVTSRTCTYPMSVFTGLAYTHIADGEVLPVTIRAINDFGHSDFSEFNSMLPADSAVAYSVPSQAIVPRTVQNGPMIDVTWEAPYDGGSPITNYTVYFQGKGDTWWYSFNCTPDDTSYVGTRTCSYDRSELTNPD